MLHNFQRSFHALSKEHRQAYTRIGLAHDPLSLSLLFPSIITLSYYISRDQRCVRTRESAIRYLTWSFLLLSSPIHHDRDLILLITRKILLPPRGEQRILRIKETGEKNHRKMGKTYRAQNFFPKHFLHLYPSCVSNCDSSSRFLLPPPPFFLLPLLLYSSRQSITGFTSFVCRDSITAAKRSMTRRHVGVARITKVDASSSSRVSRVPHRENHQSTNHPRNSFSKPNT